MIDVTRFTHIERKRSLKIYFYFEFLIQLMFYFQRERGAWFIRITAASHRGELMIHWLPFLLQTNTMTCLVRRYSHVNYQFRQISQDVL